MKKDILEKGAIVQRDRETYAIAPHIPGGITDTATLRKICDVADRYGVKELKLTSAQRIALMGVKEEDLDTIWSDLDQQPGAAIGLCVRSVKICPGTTWCKRGVQDSVALGLKIDTIYHAMKLPNKMKMGISGCMVNCAETLLKDIGVVGTPKGWRIYVGGNAGARPRIGEVFTDTAPDDDEVLAVVARIVDYYKGSGSEQRLGRIVEQMGIETFRQAVLGT
ncbi:nitrite and sulphite reductase 4Fe-4S region [Geobacter metallireducens RCH3]|uniref:Sulfite reductase, assimilatory n=1 Tax=Geobacter metallireducens (strain ATCC 53774 / DSM 7210 / GS-15) TaxID=269799 RepID=Q39QN9_GEOMG|nr:NAD(P)/FAD-dependent oxidoreductase [Geobacter metallireducens]ABB33435.1 sulfite reductase, assimilatory [Geobacter metallireducens GS-15]EHP87488.1 nitrite and sulphite reductase 4Fe-4S region [Geobacter metallireducens RCH3]